MTILDDDQPPPPPAPTFTIGGTVDGLQGSGLVLSTVGSAALPVSANGSFTFPGTASDGQPYEVKVATQPGKTQPSGPGRRSEPAPGHVNVSRMHSEGKLQGGRRESFPAATSIGGATYPT